MSTRLVYNITPLEVQGSPWFEPDSAELHETNHGIILPRYIIFPYFLSQKPSMIQFSRFSKKLINAKFPSN